MAKLVLNKEPTLQDKNLCPFMIKDNYKCILDDAKLNAPCIRSAGDLVLLDFRRCKYCTTE